MLRGQFFTWGIHMLRRLALALALAGGALATGVLTSPADALTPVVGSCHQLTAIQADQVSDPTAPVPCTGPHTSQTITVVNSPVPLVGLSEDTLFQEQAAVCVPALRRALRPILRGAQTAYGTLMFTPTPEQLAAGENWIRCDVALHSDATLVRLPDHLVTMPLVPRRIPDSIRRCYAGKTLVTCNHPHSQRSVGAFNVTAKALRSKAALIRVERRACPGATGFVWPTAEGFKDGYRVVVCYQKNRH